MGNIYSPSRRSFGPTLADFLVILDVDDLVDGIIKFMATDSENTGPMNLGNPVEFTMLELAELVIELTASNSIIQRHPLPENDPKRGNLILILQ